MKRARLVEGWPAYALGWNVMDYRGRQLVWHSGNADGQPSMMALLPDDGVGVVVMSNTWGAGLLHALLVNRVLDTYLGVPPRDWSGDALKRKAEIRAENTHTLMQLRESRVANTRPSRAIGDYAGTFTDSLYGDVIVRATDGKLTLQMGRGEIGDLTHWHYDSFLVTWRDPLFGEVFPALVAFTTDASAQVSALSMRLNRDLIVAQRGKP
ncbi:MAG: DUF3471 domain-containing protein [Gemmatimonadaceae bacterium]